MKNAMIAACALSFALGGCSTGPMQKLGSWIPGSFDDDETYLAQIDTDHKPATTAVGPEADRMRTQSEGFGLVEYPELERYLNRHLERLESASGLNGLDGRVYVSAERGFNARTSADGNIYIPIEMLNDIDNEHELAALLAHEMAHALLNHNDADLFVRLQKKAVAATALVSSLGNEGGELSKSDTRRIRNVLGMTLVSDGFLNPGWSRHQEDVADRIGLDLMVAAGYNPEGMNLLLTKIHAWDEKNAKIAAEHEARRKALLEAASQEAGADLDKQLSLVTGEVTTMLNGLFKSFAEDHPDSEARISGIADYSATHYRRAARPPMQGGEWARLRDANRTQQLIRSVALIDDAQTLLGENRSDEAAQVALEAVSDDTRNQNYVRLVLANIRQAQNNSNSVLANADYGLQGAYPAYKLHYYKGVIGAGSADRLASHLLQLNDTFTNYGKPPQYYVDLIRLADSVGNTALGSQLKIECELKYVGEAVACSPGEVARDQEISYTRMVDTLL